ncbi:hypothetical protein OGM63_21900 [Plectonema radiosum NIES-515]|uniref:Uncharacterized protein n=1 Tax=Plectonema radiosum NIES-515 TaxID=2986073 RepID=A0ABT3B4F2_9CYAN|nr:hypothetical protein [Plectonema radiosum]MCV3216130.1 hypothetical protein [Plectonema radiosum NIES-515]
MRSHRLHPLQDRHPVNKSDRTPVNQRRSPFSLQKSDRTPQSPIKKAIAHLPAKKRCLRRAAPTHFCLHKSDRSSPNQKRCLGWANSTHFSPQKRSHFLTLK